MLYVDDFTDETADVVRLMALTSQTPLRMLRRDERSGGQTGAVRDGLRQAKGTYVMPTAKRWADRYREGGAEAMEDRSSRPHHCPRRTPRLVVREIVHPRWKKRLGPVQIADRLGQAPSTVHAVLEVGEPALSHSQ